MDCARRKFPSIPFLIITLLCGWIAPLYAGASVVHPVKTRVNGAAVWNIKTTWMRVLSGSISTTIGVATVTGSGGSKFTTELAVNDELVQDDGTELGTVMSITNDTTLTLSAGALATFSGAYGNELIPAGTDDVEIGNAVLGGDVTVNLDISTSVNSLRIANAGEATNSVLNLQDKQLDVTTDVILETPGATVLDLGGTNQLQANTGTLNMRDLVLDQSLAASNAQSVILSIDNGTVSINRDAYLLNAGPGFTDLENTGSGTLNLFGAFDGFNRYNAGGTNNVAYLGTGNQLVHALPYYNLKIAGARGANTVTFDTGTHQVFATIDASATFTTGGYAKAGPFTIQLTGNALQSIIGVAGNPLVLDNLELRDPPGLAINKDVVINGDLHILSGKVLVSQTNKMVIGPVGTVSAATSARYIVGKFEKVFAPGNGQLFVAPIGDNTQYTPIVVQSLNATRRVR